MTGLHRRRKRTTSADDYAAMLRRMMAAYGKRVGTEPGASLTHLRDLETALTDAVNHGIYTANKVGGHSINELADMLGVSKQAVHKRVMLGEIVARQQARTQRTISAGKVARPRELPPGEPWQPGHP